MSAVRGTAARKESSQPIATGSRRRVCPCGVCYPTLSATKPPHRERRGGFTDLLSPIEVGVVRLAAAALREAAAEQVANREDDDVQHRLVHAEVVVVPIGGLHQQAG